MKKFNILFILLFIYTFSQAQKNSFFESQVNAISQFQKNTVVGVFFGGAYYLGEINLSKQFYKTQLAYGGFYRYDIDKRYSLRLNIFYMNLAGDDNDFDSKYQKDRNQSFKTNIFDITLLTEFNFLPYEQTNRKKNNYTPYVTAGVTYYLKDFGFGSIFDNLAIPFGFGFKYNINKQIALGTEWNFRKTFRDDIDFEYLEPSVAQKQLGYEHDKDWYSFAGIFLTYKFKTYTSCPAFN
ncbi:MAG: outer membrane beta-barrel protein [Bacteroidetes bacterium]|nr:outer membrane beta-barrel protein [Bacteroidota bacterium]